MNDNSKNMVMNQRERKIVQHKESKKPSVSCLKIENGPISVNMLKKKRTDRNNKWNNEFKKWHS